MQAGMFTYHAFSKMNSCQDLGLNTVWLLLLVAGWVLGVILLEFVSGHLSWWRGWRAVARCLHCRAADAPLSQGAAAGQMVPLPCLSCWTRCTLGQQDTT